MSRVEHAPHAASSAGHLPYRPRFQWRFLGPRFWGHWLALGVMLAITLLPWRWRHRLGRGLGGLVGARDERRQRRARINLDLCFPGLERARREALVVEHLRLAGACLLDYGMFFFAPRAALGRHLGVSGWSHVERARAEGRSVILLSCHTLGLEAGVQAAALRTPGCGIFKRLQDPFSDWLMARGRARFNGDFYPRESSLRPIVRALRGGSVLYVLPDEDLGAEASVFAPFFGVPKATVTIVGRIARMTQAVVLPCVARVEPERRRYLLDVQAPLEGFPTGDAQRDAAAVNAALERLILEAPEQYLWSLRLFQTRPDGGPTPYRTQRARRVADADEAAS